MTFTTQTIIVFASLLASVFAATPNFVKIGNGCCRSTNGKKISTASINRFTGATLATCERLCTASSACTGIQYMNKKGGICEIHTASLHSTSKCRKTKCYIAIPAVQNAAPKPTIAATAAPTSAPTSAPTPAPIVTAAPVAASSPILTASTPAPQKKCTVYPGVDFYGGDLISYNAFGRQKVKTINQCAKKCLAHPKCAKFTYAWKQCFLKTAAAGYNTLDNAISAICEFPATPATAVPTVTIAATTPTTSSTAAATPTTTAAPVTSTAAPPTTAAPVTSTAAPTTTSTAVPPTEAPLQKKGVSLTLTFPQSKSNEKLYTQKLEAQGGAVNGKLYVFGGFVDGYKYMDKETWEFNPYSKTWRKRAGIPAKWTGATHMANAVDESTKSIYLLGGITVSGTKTFPKGAMGTSDVFKYNAKTNKWSTLPSLPEARGGGAAVVLNNKLHFFNGAKFDGPHGGFQEDMSTHWVLNLGNTKAGWKTLAPNSLGRNHIGGVAWGGKIYAIGGQFHEEEGCSNQKIAEVYNPKTNAWSRIADLPVGTGHISPATLAHEHGIIIVGGVTDKNQGCKPPGNIRKQILFYNPTTDTWTDLANKHGGASRVSGIIDGKIWSQHQNHVDGIQLNWYVKNTGANFAVVAESATLAQAEAGTTARDTANNNKSTINTLAAVAAVFGMVAAVFGAVLIYNRRSDSTSETELSYSTADNDDLYESFNEI